MIPWLITRTAFCFSQNFSICTDNGYPIMVLKMQCHTDPLISKHVSKATDSPQGCQIMIFPRKGASSIIFSKNLRIGMLLSKTANQKLVLVESDDENEDSQEDNNVPLLYSYHTTKYLQAELKDKAKVERDQLSHEIESRRLWIH